MTTRAQWQEPSRNTSANRPEKRACAHARVTQRETWNNSSHRTAIENRISTKEQRQQRYRIDTAGKPAKVVVLSTTEAPYILSAGRAQDHTKPLGAV